MPQLSLLADVARDERPWKRTRIASRAAWYEAIDRGLIHGRKEIVGRALRYWWNRYQRRVTANTLAKWLKIMAPEWRDRERTWIALNVRRALWELGKDGVVESVDEAGGLRWKPREAGS